MESVSSRLIKELLASYTTVEFTANELATKLDVNPGAVSGTLNNLRKKGIMTPTRKGMGRQYTWNITDVDALANYKYNIAPGHGGNGGHPGSTPIPPPSKVPEEYPVPVTSSKPIALHERLFQLACEVEEMTTDLSRVTTEELIEELRRRMVK